MRYEIDQSGKIEDTSKDTIIAVTNSKRISVFISARNKRRLQSLFRKYGQTRLFIDHTFAILLILVLKRMPRYISMVMVDIEYPGHTKIIEEIVYREIKNIRIHWTLIGKKSNAHDHAYKVFKGHLSPDMKITFEEMVEILKKQPVGI